MKNCLLKFTILICSLWGLQALALENGRSLKPNEKEAFSGVVNISFDPMIVSSGTYPGKGYFLTAAHNLLGLGEKAKTAKLYIQITDKESLSAVPSTEYKVFLPPSKKSKSYTTSTGATVQIPLPDVMIIQLDEKHIGKLEKLSPMKLQVFTPGPNEIFAVLGAGAQDFHGVKVDGKVRIGRIQIDGIEEASIAKSYWVEGSPNASPRFGDSGGALLRFDSSSQEIFLIGVTTAVMQGQKDGKNAAIGKFQLLEDEAIVPWLKKLRLL